ARSAGLAGDEVEEAGDALQAPVRRDDAEIDAAGDGIRAVRAEFPAEADAVVVRVDVAGALELVARKAALQALHHGVDAGVAVAAEQRVAVVRGLGPGASDKVAPVLGVGRVPGGDVAVDESDGGSHLWSLHGSVAGRDWPATRAGCPRRRRRVDYLPRHWIVARRGLSMRHVWRRHARRRPPARMASPSSDEPARPGLRGRDIHPPSELRRDRPRDALARHD